MEGEIVTDKLRVWWIPQITGKSFKVPVATIQDAVLILDTLANYDIFQFENNIKGDYCNTGGLEVFEDDEWLEWECEDGGDIQDFMFGFAS
jgi:hypothetical protein